MIEIFPEDLGMRYTLLQTASVVVAKPVVTFNSKSCLVSLKHELLQHSKSQFRAIPRYFFCFHFYRASVMHALGERWL